MRLCVLENDVLDPELAARYTGFGSMFKRLFQEVGADWSVDIFNTVQGHYPASFDDYDAVLLTGSRADAFAQDAWILELRRRVTELLQTRKKLLGVCFGHQLIALCLGAEVGRAPQGWGVGRMRYQWHAPEISPASGRTEIALLASHQDQVLELPEGATLLASSAFCPVAAFAVGQEVFCVQPHPEFVEDLSSYLLDKRRALLGETLYTSSIDSLNQGHDGLDMARMMVAFVEGASDPVAGPCELRL
jgi:GMP synthase-like glutamine amidotransferase